MVVAVELSRRGWGSALGAQGDKGLGVCRKNFLTQPQGWIPGTWKVQQLPVGTCQPSKGWGVGSWRQKQRAEKESHKPQEGKDNLKNRPFLGAKKGSLISPENIGASAKWGRPTDHSRKRWIVVGEGECGAHSRCTLNPSVLIRIQTDSFSPLLRCLQTVTLPNPLPPAWSLVSSRSPGWPQV